MICHTTYSLPTLNNTKKQQFLSTIWIQIWQQNCKKIKRFKEKYKKEEEEEEDEDDEEEEEEEEEEK